VYEIDKEEFRKCSRGASNNFFVRDRILTLKNLIVLIMTMKTALQRDLDKFFKSVNQADFNIRAVTKGAFSTARSKLNPEAFKRLNTVAVDTFYQEAAYYLWGGHQVLAVDGSRLVLPNHPSVKEAFGEHGFGPKADSIRSLAICSMLYDVFNKVTIDSQIASFSVSERALLKLHLTHVKQGDLLLLDRGYPSFWLLFLLQAQGIDYCVRLTEENGMHQVKELIASGEKEQTVRFTLPKKDRGHFRIIRIIKRRERQLVVA
jgi:hypothetical protein